MSNIYEGGFSTDEFTIAVDRWLGAGVGFEDILEMANPVLNRKLSRYPGWMREDLRSVAYEALVVGIRDYETNPNYSPQATIVFRVSRMLREQAHHLGSALHVPYNTAHKLRYRPEDVSDVQKAAYEESFNVEELSELDPSNHPTLPPIEDEVILLTDLSTILSSEEFQAMELGILGGLTVRELGTELGVSSATAHRRVMSATDKILGYLRQEG